MKKVAIIIAGLALALGISVMAPKKDTTDIVSPWAIEMTSASAADKCTWTTCPSENGPVPCCK